MSLTMSSTKIREINDNNKGNRSLNKTNNFIDVNKAEQDLQSLNLTHLTNNSNSNELSTSLEHQKNITMVSNDSLDVSNALINQSTLSTTITPPPLLTNDNNRNKTNSINDSGVEGEIENDTALTPIINNKKNNISTQNINTNNTAITTMPTTIATGNIVIVTKKRISSSRTPTRKARRVKFYRNGDRFYPGITIPVSNERYRSFDSLFEDLTRLLEENVKIPGAIRTIYTMYGKKVSNLDELEDGLSYVCSCNNENFKKIEYNTILQPLANFSNKANNRLSKHYRPSSPLKNGSGTVVSGGNSLTTVILATKSDALIVNNQNVVGITSTNAGNLGIVVGNNTFSGNASVFNTTGQNSATNIAANGFFNGSPTVTKLQERDNVVHPRIVTLIRNGTKPRKIMRLLLNKRNSPSFEHILTAITQKVHLDTGYVRKVFTLSGSPVTNLADFFGADDVFFAYGTERVNNPDDFKLEAEEQKALQAIRKTVRTVGVTCKGPKPKMPVKSTKTYDDEEIYLALDESGIDVNDFPIILRERYVLGKIIGDGNFADVRKIRDRRNGLPYALKIIDKSKCKGKEHYIDAEVRVMKKLSHQHIISLIMDVDQQNHMYLVLEYISGGDLFDAITRVTRFSEHQSRIMMRHLASAMSYLHSMSIVHRDIKPENLLVELDESGNVIQLKLADFGLACEITKPLYAVCGTPTYVAPEILLETGYGLKIDVWASGIILYILLCGFPPFVSPDNEQDLLFESILSGIYEFPDPYWSDIGDEVRDLINNMLQSDPDVRFTSEDILDHFWTIGNENR